MTNPAGSGDLGTSYTPISVDHVSNGENYGRIAQGRKGGGTDVDNPVDLKDSARLRCAFVHVFSEVITFLSNTAPRLVHFYRSPFFLN